LVTAKIQNLGEVTKGCFPFSFWAVTDLWVHPFTGQQYYKIEGKETKRKESQTDKMDG